MKNNMGMSNNMHLVTGLVGTGLILLSGDILLGLGITVWLIYVLEDVKRSR
jgi:hypothetical protein